MTTTTRTTMATNLVVMIERSGFVATEAQVQQLAADVVSGNTANATYLKILLAEVQSAIGRPQGRRARTIDVDALHAVIHKAHDKFYPHILAGVGPPDMDRTERNRRAIFARTSKAALMGAANHGVDLRLVDVVTVTKAELRRRATAPPNVGSEAEGIGDDPLVPLLKTVQRAERMLLKALGSVAALDLDQAMEATDRLWTQLERIVPMDTATVAEATHVGTIVNRGALVRTPVADRPGAQLHRGSAHP